MHVSDLLVADYIAGEGMPTQLTVNPVVGWRGTVNPVVGWRGTVTPVVGWRGTVNPVGVIADVDFGGLELISCTTDGIGEGSVRAHYGHTMRARAIRHEGCVENCVIYILLPALLLSGPVSWYFSMYPAFFAIPSLSFHDSLLVLVPIPVFLPVSPLATPLRLSLHP